MYVSRVTNYYKKVVILNVKIKKKSTTINHCNCNIIYDVGPRLQPVTENNIVVIGHCPV